MKNNSREKSNETPIKENIFVTLFGKTGLNKNSVVAFFR